MICSASSPYNICKVVITQLRSTRQWIDKLGEINLWKYVSFSAIYSAVFIFVKQATKAVFKEIYKSWAPIEASQVSVD